jgi:formiminotetrahydrofolate cyclodeaminase
VTADTDAPSETDSISEPLDLWLEELAQASGSPGGGAACGVMLGVAAALLRMVARYTTGEQASRCATRLVQRRRDALREARSDSLRSADLGAALKAPAGDAHRDDSVREAALAAAESSAALGAVGVALVGELKLLAEIGNPHVAADLAVAAEALAAGLAGSAVNLRADLQLARVHDGGRERDTTCREDLVSAEHALDRAREAAAAIAAEVSAKVAER